MKNNLNEFIFATFQEAFEFMRPYLSNYEEFSKALAKETQVKEGATSNTILMWNWIRSSKRKSQDSKLTEKYFPKKAAGLKWARKNIASFMIRSATARWLPEHSWMRRSEFPSLIIITNSSLPRSWIISWESWA